MSLSTNFRVLLLWLSMQFARMPHENYNNAAMLELASPTFLYC
jgi:hypothetical protein